MKTKFWKQTFKGNLNEAEVHKAAGHERGGTIVRIDNKGGETIVYFAGENAPSGASEVSEADVTKAG
jgi:hypothetical protein